MNFTRLHVSVAVGYAFTIWAVVLLLQGEPLGWRMLSPFGLVVGGLVLAGLALDRVLWSLPMLHGWFVKRPNLRGTWRAVIRSSFDATESRPLPEIEGYMAVTQTLSELHMELLTRESRSAFIGSRIREAPGGHGYQIMGVYTNEPDVHLRSQRVSEMHQGGIVLTTHGNPARPDTLSGKYWTDRGTYGTIELRDRVPERLSQFESARVQFEGPRAAGNGEDHSSGRSNRNGNDPP